MPRVLIRNLVKKYGEVLAVDRFDLEVGDGELVVFLGPSGCGKTTTLRCVAGLESISDGEISIGDTVVSRRDFAVPTEKRAIGMVFQSYAIWPHMTVAQNVAFGLKAQGVGGAEVKRRVAAALELVGLAGLAERGASALSGGQQQRVAVARAIVLEPRILLFDEPLSNLDARLRDRMRGELRHLQKRLGITAIYVTHDQQEAMALADRIVLMRQGVVEQIGTPDEIYQRPASLFVAEFVGSTNAMTATAETQDGRTLLRVGPDMLLESAGPAPGATVDVVIRPERIRLSDTRPAGANAFRARVLSRTFYGSMSEYGLAVGGQALRSQTSPPTGWGEGAELWIQVAPEDIVLLGRNNDRQGEMR